MAICRELDHFIRSVAGGTAPLVGGEDGIKALALADAALQSHRTGRPVTFVLSRLSPASRY